ncbi:two-component system LytT family response regulator [Mucilaginibacter sp. UYP25]|uniref:LytR/AlgR family response regulator transcription factor n=1 Tax=unclassified Mucilaginibacter TaxID=2617802 RepID=UPI0033933660
MHLSCYIVDDEHHSIEVIARYVEQTPGLELLGSSTNPLEVLELFAGGVSPAITFLDVDMPQLNGLDMADLLGASTKVIFTTSFREYAPEAFEKNAVDYLLKPIIYTRFLKAITKVNNRVIPTIYQMQGDYFFVKSNIKGKFHRVDISEIRYIENIGNYITIHFGKDKERIVTYLTLSEVLHKLPEQSFTRIHQSYVVNHAFINSLEYAQVRLYDQISLPIGGTFRVAFREKIQSNILVSKREHRET